MALKFKPQFVEKQFVPTNIGLLANIAAQRDKEFDTARQLQNQATESLYGIDVAPSDVGIREEVVGNLQKQIQEAVDRRGGDYGAALTDITDIVSKTGKDPFFQLNRLKQEQSAELQKQLQRNPNLMVLRDPRNVALTRDIAEEDLRYSVLDPEEARKTAQADLKFLNKRVLSGIRTTPEGYDVAQYRVGPTEQEIQGVLQDEGITSRLRGMFPQLQGASPEVADRALRDIIETTARGFQQTPQENILGFNPLIREKIEQQSKNAYAGLIPTSGVGTKGIKNLFPVKDAKDFFNLPTDNSRMGLIRRDIVEDIEMDSDFRKENSTQFKEFRDIEGAREFVDNYVTQITSPLPDARAPRLAVPGLPTGQEPDKEQQEKFKRAKTLLDNFDTKLKDRLFRENSDLMKQFQHYDIFTGGSTLREATKKRLGNFQEFVGDQIPIEAFDFEASNNEDINFANQRELLEDGDENYLKATEGKFKITGVAIDPVLGVKLQVTTENKDGGQTVHIASPNNPDIERQIIRAYTGGNKNTQAFQQYKVFSESRLGEQLFSDLENNPDIAPPPQINNVGEYKLHLTDLKQKGLVTPQKVDAIVSYLNVIGVNNNVEI